MREGKTGERLAEHACQGLNALPWKLSAVAAGAVEFCSPVTDDRGKLCIPSHPRATGDRRRPGGRAGAANSACTSIEDRKRCGSGRACSLGAAVNSARRSTRRQSGRRAAGFCLLRHGKKMSPWCRLEQLSRQSCPRYLYTYNTALSIPGRVIQPFTHSLSSSLCVDCYVNGKEV